MENHNYKHIKADTFYTQKGPNVDFLKYVQGTLVYLRLTGEKLLILSELSPDEDEYALGTKYLTRTADHKKKVVFACEIKAVDPKETTPALQTDHK